MARLIANATGNFTSSGSWGVASTNGVVDSITGQSIITNVATTGVTFTPGVETYDGVALKLASSLTSGTFTVTLRNVTGAVDITSVTVNVSDLPSSGGWVFFKFSSPVTTLAATGYAYKVVTSVTSTVTLYRSGTTNDWTKLSRTTTIAAPGAGDQLLIMNEMTGAGTQNTITITMNNTAATIFGSLSYVDSIAVSGGGTLTYGVASSTNYLLNVVGAVTVYSSTWNQGTSGARMPSTSTGKLIFSVATNVDSGFIVSGNAVVNRYGSIVGADSTLMTASIGGFCTTNGTAVVRLSGQSFIGLTGSITINGVSYTISSVTDASNLTLTGTAGVQATPVVFLHPSTANVLRVASTADWKAGDVLAIASTSSAPADRETATILTVDSSTQVTLTSGLLNQHSGSAATPAEVIHMTRNVVVAGTSSTLQAYVQYLSTSCIINESYVEFYNLGSATAGKRGIDIQCTTGSYTAIGCVAHDFVVASSTGWLILGASTANVSITYCHAYNIANMGFQIGIGLTASTITFDHCVGIAAGFSSIDTGCTITNISISSFTATAISIIETNMYTGTINNLTVHSSTFGITLTGMMDGIISNLTAWRITASTGIGISNCASIFFNTILCFGNSPSGSSANLTISGGDNCIFTDLTAGGDMIYATRHGIMLGANCGTMYFNNAVMGVATGIRVAHSFSDVRMAQLGHIIFRNSLFASTLELFSNTEMLPSSQMFSEKHDQTVGVHKRWERSGTAALDNTTFRTAAPSETLTPSMSNKKFTSSITQPVAVDNGQTITVLVYVNKSASYNGAQPRLIVKANPAIGILTDTVLATASGGTGSWLLLTGTTAAVTDDGALVFYVDCDGTLGTVSVDDWSVT